MVISVVIVFVLSAYSILIVMMGYSSFRAASWNVNGLNNPVKRSKVMAKIKKGKNHFFTGNSFISK